MAVSRRFVFSLLLTLLGLSGLVYYGMTTAYYAAYELKRALAQRELATFYARVDVAAVINSLIDAEASRERLHATGDDWVDLKGRVNAELAKLMKADVQDQIKRDIETLFNARALEDVAPEAVGRLLPTRNFLRRVDGFDFGSLTVAGREAHWNVIVHTGFIQKSYPLVIRMKNDERWRVVAVDGLATVIDLFERDAQEFTERANLALREELGRSVQVQLEGVERTQNWLLKKTLSWRVSFRNGSPHALISLEGNLILRDAGRDVAREPLPPGQWNLASGGARTFSFETSMDYFDPKAWETFDASRLTVVFEATAVQFEGSATRRWIKHWDEWPRDSSVSKAKRS